MCKNNLRLWWCVCWICAPCLRVSWSLRAGCVAYAPGWRVRLSLQGRCSEGNPPFPSQENPSLQCDKQASRVCLILHIIQKSSTEHQQIPFPSFRVIWCGWCQRPDTRRDGPVVCAAAQFLCPCVTLLFLFYLLCLCLLCSLVELEKEVNNIKTGLKAVETVSIWRFPK